jgi:hypothetical protein
MLEGRGQVARKSTKCNSGEFSMKVRLGAEWKINVTFDRGYLEPLINNVKY